MRRLMPVLVVVLFTSACGGSDTTTTQPPTQQTTTTIEVATTTSSRPATIPPTSTSLSTTTIADPRFVAGELSLSCGYTEPEDVGPGSCVDSLYHAEALPGSEGAAGSGCTPGTTSLPAGMWLGVVTAKSANSIEFDLACIYFGAPGYVEEDSSEDFRNTNPTMRTIAVDRSVPVYVIAPVEVGFITVPFADWPEDPDLHPSCPSERCLVWLFINGAEVTEILEQSIPNALAPAP